MYIITRHTERCMAADGVDIGSNIVIERVDAPTEDVRALIDELDREFDAIYPPEQWHGLSVDAIFQPHMRFFVARRDGRAVGCGGIALLADFAEIKRVYVRPDVRGLGVADAIIARLSAEALDAGLGMLRLETGTRQAAAIRFYQRSGFQPCAAFEPYASMPPHALVNSLFFEKAICASAKQVG
jgi:putative acetyltransferase